MRNDRFNPGDLCVIIQCKAIPENVGKVVTLEEFVPQGCKITGWAAPPYDAWIVRGEGLLCRYAIFCQDAFETDRIGVAQESLMKIGDKDPDLSKIADRALEKVS